MEFCPECGKLLVSGDRNGKEVLVCPGCNYVKEEGENVHKETIEQKEDVVVIEEGDLHLPETEAICEKCENGIAYYWIEQTRSADEAPTRFYKCKKCGHTWREYS